MIQRIKKALNTLIDGNVVHPHSNQWGISMPRTRFDYAREVGTGLGSNVIMSPVQWIMRTFPESCLKLERLNAKGEKERITEHQFLSLLENPNDFYNYEALMMGTLLSWSTAGNSYWFKSRNNLGQVIELWYLPHWFVSPRGHATDNTVFIDHYEYNPNGQLFCIPPEDIVHFRFGVNPENTREGLSPLAAVLREVFTDDEASNYSASMLRNFGIPGVMISPAKEEVEFSDKQVKALKEKFRHAYTGDKRGDTMVMKGPTKVETFGFDSKQMALSDVRDISEERVCAALGINPVVVGFGAGLQTSKVGATVNAYIKLAWTGNIIPTQRIISQVLQKSLLSEFENDKSVKVGFDNSNVLALQEDKDKKVARIGLGVQQGWATVANAREAEGLPVDESHDIFLRPMQLIPEENN